MSTNEIILITVLGAVAGMLIGFYLRKFLAAKKIDLSAVEAKADKVLQYVLDGMEALAPFLPGKYATILETVAKAVASAVEKIEDLNSLGLLPDEQRKAKATELIIKELTNEKITIDANVQKLISVAIDSACLVLPGHISMETAAEATVQPASTTAQ